MGNGETGVSTRSMDVKTRVARIPIFVWVTVAILIGTVVAATVISNILTSTTTLPRPQYWGTFYYPWYCDVECPSPYTLWRHWRDGGHSPPDTWASKFLPDDGSATFNPASELYSSLSATVINRHLTWMDYARLDFAAVSWWGQNSFEDQALRLMLTKAQDNASLQLKLVSYYECVGHNFVQVPSCEASGRSQPDVEKLVSDLTYIYDNRANFISYFRISPQSLPVVFVYGNDTYSSCEAGGYVDTWSTARDRMNASGKPIFIVLKVFPGWGTCAGRVDSWHQYRPDVNETQPSNCPPIDCNSFPHYELQQGFSALATPGFWDYRETTPRLNRNPTGFAVAVATMASLPPSRAQFLLIETFNEWHEGTQVEPGLPANTDVSPYTQAGDTYGLDYLNIIRNRE